MIRQNIDPNALLVANSIYSSNANGNKITVKRILLAAAWVASLVSALVGIYAYYQNTQETYELQYEILANTNVLDINANVSKLDIQYNGNSLKNNKQSLKLLNIRVRNTGGESIRRDSYDIDDPLGVKVVNGNIIEQPELVSTSNSYIKNKIKFIYNNKGELVFNELILDPGDFYTVKLLILHADGQETAILPIGKIAGIRKINVVSLVPENKLKKPFWTTTIGGGLIVQFTRWMIYFVSSVILIILCIWGGSSFQDWQVTKRRKIIAKKFKKTGICTDDKDLSNTLDVFAIWGVPLLKIFASYLAVDDLNAAFSGWLQDIENYNLAYQNSGGDKSVIDDELSTKNTKAKRSMDVINKLVEHHYLERNGTTLSINTSQKEDLDFFLLYLDTNGYKEPDRDMSFVLSIS